MNNINSPTENPNFLDTINESISVPSNEASLFNIVPTPTPKIIPPNTVANNKSFVATILWKKFRAIASIRFPYKVNATNRDPIFFHAIIIKGRFNITINNPKFQLATLLNIIETPITPPSIILFGDKNEASANAVIIAPIVMKNMLFIVFATIFFAIEPPYIKHCMPYISLLHPQFNVLKILFFIFI